MENATPVGNTETQTLKVLYQQMYAMEVLRRCLTVSTGLRSVQGMSLQFGRLQKQCIHHVSTSCCTLLWVIDLLSFWIVRVSSFFIYWVVEMYWLYKSLLSISLAEK